MKMTMGSGMTLETREDFMVTASPETTQCRETLAGRVNHWMSVSMGTGKVGMRRELTNTLGGKVIALVIATSSEAVA